MRIPAGVSTGIRIHLEGQGEVGPGGFVWRPGGNIHIARAPEGATFLSVFMKPNRFFGGAKFFTE